MSEVIRECTGGKISTVFEPSHSSHFYCLSFAWHSLGFISVEKFPQKMDRLQPVFLPRLRTRSEERVWSDGENGEWDWGQTRHTHAWGPRSWHENIDYTGASHLAKQILRKKNLLKKTLKNQFKGRRDGNVRLLLRYGKIGDKNVQFLLRHCCKMRPRPNVELFMRRSKL